MFWIPVLRAQDSQCFQETSCIFPEQTKLCPWTFTNSHVLPGHGGVFGVKNISVFWFPQTTIPYIYIYLTVENSNIFQDSIHKKKQIFQGTQEQTFFLENHSFQDHYINFIPILIIIYHLTPLLPFYKSHKLAQITISVGSFPLNHCYNHH